MNIKIISLLLLLLIFISNAHSAENGSAAGAIPFGVDGQSYLELPPPGLYLMNYTGYFRSDEILDNHGRNAAPGAKVDAAFNLFRLSYAPEKPIWGAQSQVHEIFPTIVKSELRANGHTERKSGLSDLAIDPFGLAWTFGNVNVGFSTTFIVPVGSYSQNDAVNLGKNYYTWIPQIFYTHYLPKGWGDFSVHAGYEYSWANEDGLKTQLNPDGDKYKSGQIAHAEAALTHYMGNWRVGVNVVGHYQVTNDKIYHNSFANDFLQGELDGNKYQKVSAGLTAQYRIGGVVPVTLTYLNDTYARSTAKGDSVVLRVVIPLMMF